MVNLLCTSHPLPLDHGGGQRDSFSSSLTEATYFDPGLHALSQTVGHSSRHVAGNVSQQATYQLARADGESQWHSKGAFALGLVCQLQGTDESVKPTYGYDRTEPVGHTGDHQCARGAQVITSGEKKQPASPHDNLTSSQGLGKPLLGGTKFKPFWPRLTGLEPKW